MHAIKLSGLVIGINDFLYSLDILPVAGLDGFISMNGKQPPKSPDKSLDQWRMKYYDVQTLKFLYPAVQPERQKFPLKELALGRPCFPGR